MPRHVEQVQPPTDITAINFLIQHHTRLVATHQDMADYWNESVEEQRSRVEYYTNLRNERLGTLSVEAAASD